jgi:hypothetical protein
MNQKFLYVCPRDIAVAHSRHFITANWIDLPNGSVLLSGEFSDEQRKDLFEQNISVEPCCHDGDTVTQQHAQKLASIGVRMGNTAKQVRTAAKKIHGLM